MCERVEYAEPDADPSTAAPTTTTAGDAPRSSASRRRRRGRRGAPLVVVHSGDRVPTQKQDAYKHVLDELGVHTELTPSDSADMVDETGFGFYYQPAFNPAIDDLFDRPRPDGVRTFVNTIETTLANPAGASVHLGSFYHLAFAKKVVDTFVESEFHDLDRVLMFQGMEGTTTCAPGYTKVAEWDGTRAAAGTKRETPAARGASFDDFEIETAKYGMDLEEEDLAVDDVAVESAEITEAVLTGARRALRRRGRGQRCAPYLRPRRRRLDRGTASTRPEQLSTTAPHDVLEALRDF